MKKFTVMVVAAVVAALTVVLPAQSAQANTAYADIVCNLEVSDASVVGGTNVTIVVSSDLPTDLSVTFLGETRTRTDSRLLLEVFQTPVVTTRRTATITATCDGSTRTATLEILPVDGGGDDGDGTDGDGVDGDGTDGDGVDGEGTDGGSVDGDGLDGDADGVAPAADGLDDGGLTTAADEAAAGNADQSFLGGILPRTGGPAWWLMLLGLALAVTGAVVAVHRRRA